MSEMVRWLKTGKRGARAEFTDSDLITTLLLLSIETMGRYKLQEELLLSDSSTKSLLNYCKKRNLLEITSSRKGHSLTKKGNEIVELIKQVILYHGKSEREFFDKNEHYFVLINGELLNENIKTPSWKIRDFAIAYGADSILHINISSEENFSFPEGEIILEDYYPGLPNYFKQILDSFSISNNNLLIVASKKYEIARKSAIISSLTSYKSIFKQIQNML